jgi:hypothetical protein
VLKEGKTERLDRQQTPKLLLNKEKAAEKGRNRKPDGGNQLKIRTKAGQRVLGDPHLAWYLWSRFEKLQTLFY